MLVTQRTAGMSQSVCVYSRKGFYAHDSKVRANREMYTDVELLHGEACFIGFAQDHTAICRLSLKTQANKKYILSVL